MSDTPADIIASLPADLRRRVQSFALIANQQFQGGLTWGEFGTLLIELLRLVVAGLDAVTTMSGPAKKAAAVGVAAGLFDTFADKAVPLVAYPFWIVARPIIRTLILALAGGAVEAILPMTRSANA